MLQMPLVAVDEESRTRPPRPRQKTCVGHDCRRIEGSQKLLYKNLFRKVSIFVSPSTELHAKYRLSFRQVQIPFRKVQIFILQSTNIISFRFAKFN